MDNVSSGPVVCGKAEHVFPASRELNLTQIHRRNDVVTGKGGRVGFYLMAKDYRNEDKPWLHVTGLK